MEQKHIYAQAFNRAALLEIQRWCIVALDAMKDDMGEGKPFLDLLDALEGMKRLMTEANNLEMLKRMQDND